MVLSNTIKQRVLTYFREHPDEVVYPSDIATALDLDYDHVERALKELQQEVKIAKTPLYRERM